MKFKTGDKVKVVHNSNGSYIVNKAMNKLGIVKFTSSERMIYVEFDEQILPGSDVSVVGFFKDEIEKVSEKGKQLLFSFMY